MRMGMDATAVLWDWCLGKTMQLIHADGMRNGIRFQWRHFFEPSKELLDKFEQITNQELEDL